ncbi:MAG: PfkB family carbohydrate kinase [Bacteroidota bacterium]
MERKASISVAGGIFWDIRGQASKGWISRDSQPGEVRYSPGGVARNIAENLARLDIPVRLFGQIGHDRAGQEMMNQLTALGVDTLGVGKSQDQDTGTDLSLLDETGGLQASITDLSICEELTPDWAQRQLARIFPCEYLILETNLPVGTLQTLILEANRRQVPVVLDPVSQPLAQRLASLRGNIFLFCPNEGEWNAFQQASPSLHCQHILLTRGAQGLKWINAQGQSIEQAALPAEVKDLVGAGDSCLAAVVAALYRGATIAQALLAGAKAGAICVASTQTVAPDISAETVLAKRS